MRRGLSLYLIFAVNTNQDAASLVLARLLIEFLFLQPGSGVLYRAAVPLGEGGAKLQAAWRGIIRTKGRCWPTQGSFGRRHCHDYVNNPLSDRRRCAPRTIWPARFPSGTSKTARPAGSCRAARAHCPTAPTPSRGFASRSRPGTRSGRSRKLRESTSVTSVSAASRPTPSMLASISSISPREDAGRGEDP
jgi:hypothetical protein